MHPLSHSKIEWARGKSKKASILEFFGKSMPQAFSQAVETNSTDGVGRNRSMLTRRQMGHAVAGAAVFGTLGARRAQAAPITANGVKIGVAAGSYRDIPRSPDQAAYIAALARACAESGAGLIEFHASQVEPEQAPVVRPAPDAPKPTPEEAEAARQKAAVARTELRKWRLATPASYYAGVRRVFEAAGTTPFAYAMVFTDDMTDDEIEAIFVGSKAMGCQVISTNATKVSMGPRLAPFAERHRLDLGFHNHAAAEDPNEVASIASFEKLFAISPRCRANLDIGHFTASNQDPIAFINKHHERITHLHIKDRKKNKGPNLPWGEGDTPIREALLLIKRNKYPIPCIAEYEYYNSPGNLGSIAEDRKCLEYMRATLA